MDQYIQQLIDTIEEAISSHRNGVKMKASTLYLDAHLAAIEDWLNIDKVTITSASDIHDNFFPPEYLLTDSQLRILYDLMLRFLKEASTLISLPLEIPIRDKYTIVQRAWMTFPLFDYQGYYIPNFCSENYEDCDLMQYCKCAKQVTTEIDVNKEVIIDNFYISADDVNEPMTDEGDILFEELWKNYNPVNHITSKYIKQLVEDIYNIPFNYNKNGKMKIYHPENDVIDPSLKYFSIYHFLNKLPIDFPPTSQLSMHEADAISKALMDVFNDDFFNEYLPYQLFDTRYNALINLLDNDVRLLDDRTFMLKPMSEEKLAEENKKIDKLNERMFGLSFDKNESEENDENENEDLPF